MIWLALAPAARADERHRAAEAETFQPASDPWGLLTVEGGRIARPWQWGFGLHTGFVAEPLSLPLGSPPPDPAPPVVDYRLALHLQAFVGLFDWIQLGLEFSLVRQWLGDGFDPDDPTGFPYNDPLSNTSRWPPSVVAGDMRLSLKLRLLRRAGLHLAAFFAAVVPVGDETVFAGERGWAGEGRVALSYELGRLRLAANVGYLLRPESPIYEPVAWRLEDEANVLLELDDELIWGLGLRVAASSQIAFSVECQGRVPVLAEGPGDLPLEILAGIHVKAHPNLTLTAGGGAGLGRYVPAEPAHLGRTPSWRVFLGVGYVAAELATDTRPESADADGDGVPDEKDRCPSRPEDRDGFEDDDGCPDPDNDGDGIPDEKDRCPDRPEDRDGFRDDDGCPDTDNDGDGVPDRVDRCPGQPEDRDGFEDDDGCPEIDNDGDGIPDTSDKCPNEAEDRNGLEDDDGCPDGGRVDRHARKKLEGIRLQFPPRRAGITGQMKKKLEMAYRLIRNNTQLGRIRIEGHADRREARWSRRLGRRRAIAVRQYLIQRGIAAARLDAVGYGAKRPLKPSRTPAGRRANRRVDFIVLVAP